MAALICTLLKTAELHARLETLLGEHEECHVAVAWATGCEFVTALCSRTHRQRVRRLVVGIDGAATEPEALLAMIEAKLPLKIRKGSGQGGIFHPKLYYFRSKTRAAAAIGSANMTHGAFHRNEEVLVFLEGGASEPVFKELEACLDTAEERAVEKTAKWVRTTYRAQWAKARKLRKALEVTEEPRERTKANPQADLLELSWAEYAQRVQDESDRKFTPDATKKRLTLLAEVRRWLSTTPFENIDLSRRKAIAGVLVGVNERQDVSVRKVQSGWFGSMGGSGTFRNTVAERARDLGLAMSEIPESGEVTREHFEAFVARFEKATNGLKPRPGVTCASRLLAMKRPDVFVCVTGGNKDEDGNAAGNIRQLANALGLKKVAFGSFERYWDEVLPALHSSAWYRSPRPKGTAGKLWDARMALLDALFYEPTAPVS